MDEMEFTEAESNMHDLVHPHVNTLTGRSQNINNTRTPLLTRKKSMMMKFLLKRPSNHAA
jgi:hypothetical protein